MKKCLRLLSHRVKRKIYFLLLKAKHEFEEDSLMRLKSSGGPVVIGDGCVFHDPEFISIGADCRFGRGCRIQAVSEYNDQVFSPELVIGNNVTMEDWCHIGCMESVEIGDGTMIASRVFISDHSHGTVTSDDLNYPRPYLRPLVSNPVKIGNNVWLGEGACIMPGVTLGNNVIVGANAVVTHSFPANAVIAGCPAKLIKYLSDENRPAC